MVSCLKDRIICDQVIYSLVVQTVKSLSTMWETKVRSLGWGDPLEKEMAIHSGILAWKNPMDGGAWQVTVHVVTKSQT